MSIGQIRFGGLVSGLDTDSMLKELMRAERQPLNKLYQERQLLEWKKEMYREINSLFLSFRDELSPLRLQGTFLARTAHLTNPAVADVKVLSNYAPNHYSFKVEQLATNAELISKEKTAYTSLTDDLGLTEPVSFTLNTKEGSTVTITLEAGDKVSDLLRKVNEHSAETGIRASFDATLQRFFFTHADTGEDSVIRIDTDDDFANMLKLKLDGEEGEIEARGQNARVIFNPDSSNPLELEYTGNQFTFNGMEITLKSAGTTYITVTQDTEAIVQRVKSFVEGYNKLIDEVNKKLSETRYRDYMPLTDEQKEEMSDKQIELWEEKAKSGLLRNDRLLGDILTNLRTALSAPVLGMSNKELDQMSEWGITTGQYYERGKLYLDEDKLRAALARDADAIMEFFAAAGEDDDPSTWGVGKRLYAEVNKALDMLSERAGSSTSFRLEDDSVLGKQIEDINDRIAMYERRLQQIEARYNRQFVALEMAISRMNAQSAWLFEQFGMGSSM